jgi:molybdate transport system substrate-binding protein
MMRAVVVVVACLTGACSDDKPSTGGRRVVKVAAASDLTAAFAEIAKVFEAKTGIQVVNDFGSSGLKARQIKEGAPVDLFAAANVKFVDDVVAAGKCDGATKAMYGRGKIVMWVRDGKPVPGSLADLADPKYQKVAIANPDHAPYGKAAMEAMQKVGTWTALDSGGRLILGEDIAKTFRYAQTGDADVAIVALSLSIVAKGGTAVPIPDDLHDPIDQALVVCGKAGNTAEAKELATFLGAPDGRTIMKKFGFVLPGETP